MESDVSPETSDQTRQSLTNEVPLSMSTKSDITVEAKCEEGMTTIQDDLQKKMDEVSVVLNLMHCENDRMKSLLEKEKAALRNEYESVILKKEKDLSATLQKLDEMKTEYGKNVQNVRERMMGERKEVETQLACEKGKSLALSEKLHDAVQLADRTLLAYNSQKELPDARQEIIDNLRKEIEDGKQGYFHIPAVTLKTVGVMTSDCSSNKMENECQDLREKIKLQNTMTGKLI